jgi:hypothetical protein
LGFNINHQPTGGRLLFNGLVAAQPRYVNEVVRPGSQIDLVINPNLVPTSATFGSPGGLQLPAFPQKSTGFWAQGLNFGLEFTF